MFLQEVTDLFVDLGLNQPVVSKETCVNLAFVAVIARFLEVKVLDPVLYIV